MVVDRGVVAAVTSGFLHASLAPHRLRTCCRCSSSAAALEPALGSLRLRPDLLRLARRRLARRDDRSSPDGLTLGASGRDLRPRGRAARDRARRAASAIMQSGIGPDDPAQPRDHVHDPGHLDRRAHRRPDRRRRDRLRDGRAREAPRAPSTAASTPLVAHLGSGASWRLLAISVALARSKYPSGLTRWTRSARSPAVSRPSWRSAARASWRSPSPSLDRPGAEAFIAREAHAHRNPTHVVPAFRLRDGTAFSSDAGEPAGSAGAPLLAALARRRAARCRRRRRALVRRHEPRRRRPRAGLRRCAGARARRAPRCAASARPRCGCATPTT